MPNIGFYISTTGKIPCAYRYACLYCSLLLFLLLFFNLNLKATEFTSIQTPEESYGQPLRLPPFAAEFISIQIPEELKEEEITKIAIDDFSNLLIKSYKCSVTLEDKEAEINIVLPVPKLAKFKGVKDTINQKEGNQR